MFVKYGHTKKNEYTIIYEDKFSNNWVSFVHYQFFVLFDERPSFISKIIDWVSSSHTISEISNTEYSLTPIIIFINWNVI